MGNRFGNHNTNNLKVKGHLRVCGNGEFRIFPLLQMRFQDTN